MRALLLLLLLPAALAAQGSITLLTVSDGDVGGTASLHLATRPGTGQIFVDTYPLSKLDTQGSIRYANQVACSLAQAPCGRYDFFYTIRASSSVVGGPSAGAAAAVLTAAVLTGQELDDDVVITGTITSGGLVGPVAGVKAKALAAADSGKRAVLISAFSYPTELNESYEAQINASGLTLNLSKLYTPVNLSALPIPVIPVATLEDAMTRFTSERFGAPAQPLAEEPAYAALMRRVSDALCERRDDLAAQAPDYEDTGNFTEKRGAATAAQDWYSLASYCFSESIQIRTALYRELTPRDLRLRYAALGKQLGELDAELTNTTLVTLAQLETRMIVEERLREARIELSDQDTLNISPAGLAFATERANSALAWSAFYDLPSPAVELDEHHLRTACAAKLSEAEERISYLELYLPEEYTEDARRELGAARRDQDGGEHALCLFRAAKSVAQVGLLGSTLYVPEEKIADLLDQKLAAAEHVLARQQANGLYPILGYSYYRYAQSLAAHDDYSALTFAEYALELSNLDLYFPHDEERGLAIDPDLILLFGSGVLLGLVLGILLTIAVKRK